MAKELRANIIINAQGEGFEELGNTIMTMGTMINQLSGPVIEFGKDSLNVYRDYEKAMTDAEIALSTKYGRGTRELSQVMGKLDEQATEWAANSIFHTNDVANAISNAAHAGWDYEKIISGIPAAMYLAQAGSLDLSQAVDYIVKSTNSLGIEFDKTTDFVDLWTFAANSSATTIDEVGQAMLRMGGTMQFADNEAELLTMISVLANAGTTGEAAGTLLRNSMLRLIAPTKKAADVMAGLGVDSEEVAEIMNDANVEAANAQLTMHGFSAYDENGELKPMLDTFTDLYSALVDINGGVEGLFDNEEVLGIVSAIFPTRTIAGAIALLNAAADGYGGLYDAMMGGEAEGYGEWAAKLENDTLYGSQEMFLSKLERLKQVTGEELSGQMEEIYTWLGGIIDTIAEMDPDNFSALVRAFEVLAVAGPGMMIAGAALKVIANPVGAMALAAVGFGMTVAYLKQLDELSFENNFGDLKLDPQPISDYIYSLGAAFREGYAEVEIWDQALETSFQKYGESAENLKSSLVTSMLSHTTLSDADKQAMYGLADEMASELEKGIEANYSGITASVLSAFGGEGNVTDEYTWNSIRTLMVAGYEENIAEAEALSQQLREAMTSAFADGSLTADELENITSIMKQMNDAMALQYDQQNATEQSRLLRKAQGLSLDDLDTFVGEVTDLRDAQLERLYEQQDNDIAWMEVLYDKAIENGWWIDQNGNITSEYVRGAEKVTGEHKRNALSVARGNFSTQNNAQIDTFNRYLMDELFPLWMEDSDLNTSWDALSNLATEYEQGGGYIAAATLAQYADIFKGQDAKNVGKYLQSEIAALGGEQTMLDQIAYLEGIGDYAQANEYRHLLNMSTIYGTGSTGITGKYNLPDGAYDSSTFEGKWYGGYKPGSENALLKLLEDTGFDVGDQLPLQGLYNAIMSGDIYGNYDLFGGLETNARNAGYFQDSRFDPNSATYGRDVLAGMVLDAMGAPIPVQIADTGESYEVTEPTGLGYLGPPGEADTILAGLAAVGSSYTDLQTLYDDIFNNPDSVLTGDTLGVLMENAINAGFVEASDKDYSHQSQAIIDMLETDLFGAPQEHEAPEDTYDEMSFGEVANSLITDVGALMLQGAATYQDITTKPFAEMMSGEAMPSFGSFLAETFPSYSERFYNYQPDWTPAMQAEAQPEEMQVKVTADDTELEAGIQEHDGDQITVNADADTSEMDAEINSFNGTRIDTYATIDTSAVQSSLDSYQGYTITAVVTVSPGGGAGGWQEQAYAEGGRADTASIFGEAGPEWAIPEQHTERTAELLNATREASGFTWPELINRFGGLNSDPNHTPTTLVYSPTINAVDANGVASVLAADKTRLEQWWEDKQTRDAVEVYA